jgi:hypothetical protein
MKTISSFRGEYDFLSNMHPSPFTYKGCYFTCAEALFQAMKTTNENALELFDGIPGSEAKRIGRRIDLRPDWENIKVDIMRWVIKNKFRHERLAEMLLATGDAELIEGNTWGDTFWGVCNGRGQNMLGKILMEEREALRAERQ